MNPPFVGSNPATPASTDGANRAVLARLLDAWTRADALAAAGCFAAGGTYEEAGRAPLVGPAAIRAHVERYAARAGAYAFEVEATVVEDDRAAVVYRFVATSGGASAARSGIAFVRFADGTVATWREYAR